MRTIIAIMCVVVGAVAGHSFRAAPAQAQSAEWLPFNGSTVQLLTDLPQSVLVCKVSQVHNGFIGCVATQQQPERWINLRFVKEITPHRDPR